MMDKLIANLDYERAAQTQGHAIIAGVDEVGRGPLAGPVTAAAVILDLNNIPPGLADSKALTAAKRERLFDLILASAQCCIAHATVEEIDQMNILRASHLAMERAVAGLPQNPDHILIDGNLIPQNLKGRTTAIVKGDAKSLSIAAASIIAKVTRDRIMVDLAQQYPGYGWQQNAGYPTKLHLSALLNLGVTPWHRRSFKPIHNILYQDNSITP
jgi:ribonuclease HII